MKRKRHSLICFDKNYRHEIGSGVEGLLWAFKMVREFIGTHMYENDRIIVYGSDARRQKVYKHFLTTRLGFEEILDPYWGRCFAKNL